METPTGTARAEAPGMSVAREKAEAVPVESVAPVTEIDDFYMYCIKKEDRKQSHNSLSLSTV